MALAAGPRGRPVAGDRPSRVVAPVPEQVRSHPHDSDLVVDPPGALDRQLGFLERLDGEIEAFVEEGRLREGYRSGGAWHDKVVMGLFAHELRD